MIQDFALLIANLALEIVSKFGYMGVLFGMILESSFIPFPSEAILIPAGMLVSKGEMSFTIVLILAILGSLIGALINYFLALTFGRPIVEFLIDKYGKFILINKRALKKTDKYFEEHGESTTFIGRLIPVIRQLISIPAGFSNMNIYKFSIFTSLGAGIWAFILILSGIILKENSYIILKNLNYIIILMFIGLFIFYISKRKKLF